jgi:uncharacterized membrane protein (UPF0127 family)
LRHVLVHNLSRPTAKPVLARYCATFFCRLRGLTFRHSLPATEGLLLVQKRDSRLDAAIHMLGVFMDLGIAWINSNEEVVDIRLARAWRPMYTPIAPARYVLEISPLRLADFQIGDKIRFEEIRID